MPFHTTFGGKYLTLSDDMVIGTAMLGADFGTVKSAMLKRTGEREEIKNQAGELRLLLIKNPGFELLLECAFEKTVQPPGLLEVMSLPLIGVQGHVMEGVTVKWEAGGERVLSIPVASWDVMANAAAYRLQPGSGGQVVIMTNTAPALAAAAGTAGTIALSWPAVTGADRYFVETSRNGIVGWTALIDTGGLSHTHTGLGSEDSRHYRLRARFADGQFTPWSGIATATTIYTPLITTAPVITLAHHIWPPPANSVTSPHQLKVTGSRVANAAPPAGGSFIGYEVQVSTAPDMSGAVTWSVPRTNNMDESQPWSVASSVIPDRLHYVRARGTNAAGAGPWSALVSLHSQPEAIIANTLNLSTRVLSWTLVNYATSGHDSFRIFRRYKLPGAAAWTIAPAYTLGPDQLSYDLGADIAEWDPLTDNLTYWTVAARAGVWGQGALATWN